MLSLLYKNMILFYNLPYMKNELIIVAGCSGSGKTTVAKKIFDNFKPGWAQIICLDRFYLKDKNKIPKLNKNGNINFDHPLAFD
jgi:uridine kinase